MTDFLTDLHEAITMHEIDDSTARSIVSSISRLYGGMPLYVKKRNKKLLEQRNAQIKSKFTGRNHADLCREFGLCYQQICKIVNAKN